MQQKNPYSMQINDLTQRLENEDLNSQQIVETVHATAKRDVMSVIDTERRMLGELCLKIVDLRVSNPMQIITDPESLVTELETLISQYASDRYFLMTLKKTEYDFTEAMLESAVKQINGESFQ